MQYGNDKEYHVRPWVRYWARGIDMVLWALLIWTIEKLFIPYEAVRWFNSLAWGMVASFVIFATWSFVEAFLLSWWGFTPGKWILYTEVIDLGGRKLTYKAAFSRVWNIFVYGEGFQVPIASLVANIMSYNKLNVQGKTKWDLEGNYRVLHREIEVYKIVIAVLIFIGYSLLMYLAI